jgi:predicted molibdopterin-dependent oxidoreductase YjgC
MRRVRGKRLSGQRGDLKIFRLRLFLQGQKKVAAAMKHILTTCVYCGCGCGVYLHVNHNRVNGSSPSKNHPVSRHNLCVKGWHLHEFIHDHQRLTTPLMRKGTELVPVTWDEALTFTANELRRIRESYGSDALGVLASAKCTNEENYLLQKFTRAVLRTNNIDHCARL